MEFSQLMEAKKDILSSNGNLGYSTQNSQALQTIKQKLNSATSSSDLNNALPEDWKTRIESYKNIINTYFDNDARKQNLITRLNQTVPTTIIGNNLYNEDRLKNEIIDEFKKLTNERIDGLTNKQLNERNDLKQRIQAISNPNNYSDLLNKVKEINNIVLGAAKENYNTFIDNKLMYPKDNNLSSKSNATKTKIKNRLTKNFTFANKTNVEFELNNLKSNIDILVNEINTVQPESEKTKFKNEFSDADTIDKITKLIQKVRIYKSGHTIDVAKQNARDVINQIKDSNEKSKLLEKLNKKNITISEIENIKNEATNKKQQEINDKKAAEKINVESISYPGGKNSPAIDTLKKQVENAQSVDEINELHMNNEKIKEAVQKLMKLLINYQIQTIKKNN
ncbi:hypothetical protein NWP96_03965 [Mycoplasmopsis cynos]|nr:hypothetical protein [Mycoplasmopsis cynos]